MVGEDFISEENSILDSPFVVPNSLPSLAVSDRKDTLVLSKGKGKEIDYVPVSGKGFGSPSHIP